MKVLSVLLFAGAILSANALVVAPTCKTDGCSGEICADINAPSNPTLCIYRPEYECYKSATCKRQSSTGECGWTQSKSLLKCLAKYETPTSPAPAPSKLPTTCKRTGCSGEICSSGAVASPCLWKPEYACYSSAQCALQANGYCGWTMTDSLSTCLANSAGGV
ncbi:hypothetical protein HK098_002020 [Nowakowskiella sp. JEL0407]|nr:hypothetical protein HK098_002020 [Nowakowskiella sp. JEL0407]